MSLRVKGVSSMRSFQYFGFIFSSSTAWIYMQSCLNACQMPYGRPSGTSGKDASMPARGSGSDAAARSQL